MSDPKEDAIPAQALLDFIDASPSPWHAVDTAMRQLQVQGYRQLHETDRWQLEPGGKFFVTRSDASLIAFIVGRKPLTESGFRIVGAHTDSPGLRLKPKAAYSTDGMARLGVEVYAALYSLLSPTATSAWQGGSIYEEIVYRHLVSCDSMHRLYACPISLST
jgi:aspartyl aminopeptidase